MSKNKQIKVTSILCSLALIFCFNVAPSVLAQSSSTNYKVEEVYFGIGGELESTSTNYGSQTSGGSLGAGSSSSGSYDAESGFFTPSEPFLEAGIMATTADLGTLTDSATSSVAAQGGACNCSFYVRTYLSSTYSVITASQPPTNPYGDSLDAKAALGVPSVDNSVEEFGINLVDNSSPDVGANPENDPDDTFADGEAATDYNVADQFKYGVGDIIAGSQATPGNQAVGRTNYTISYIAKVSTITPAGLYQMDHDLIVVATF
jgi:hypothetical protein